MEFLRSPTGNTRPNEAKSQVLCTKITRELSACFELMLGQRKQLLYQANRHTLFQLHVKREQNPTS